VGGGVASVGRGHRALSGNPAGGDRPLPEYGDSQPGDRGAPSGSQYHTGLPLTQRKPLSSRATQYKFWLPRLLIDLATSDKATDYNAFDIKIMQIISSQSYPQISIRGQVRSKKQVRSLSRKIVSVVAPRASGRNPVSPTRSKCAATVFWNQRIGGEGPAVQTAVD
jgi:hypothetical protein